MSHHTINGISNISASFDTIDELASMKSMEYPVTGARCISPKSRKTCGCTSKESGLVIVIVLLVLLSVSLIALLLWFHMQDTPTTGCRPQPVVGPVHDEVVQEKDCFSPTCMHLSSRVLSLMDKRVSPCDDFYQFACGEGEKGSYIAWQAPTQSAFKKATDENDRRIREILEEPGYLLRGSNSTAVMNAKKYYESCLNLAITEKEGRITVLKLIENLGSWPLTTNDLSGKFNPQNFDIEMRLAKAFRMGSFPIMVMAVGQDPFNDTWTSLQVGPGTFQVTSDPEKLQTERESFIQFFTDVTESFGTNPMAAREAARQVWDLGVEFSQVAKGQVWRNTLDNIATQTASEFSVATRDYLDFSKLVRLTFGEDIPENEKILVLQEDYFNQIGPIINRADKEVLATYIIWQVLVDMAPYLYSEIRRAKEIQQSQVYGAMTIEQERWEVCVSRTVESFTTAVDALYVEKYSTEKAKEEATEIINVLQAKLSEQIESSPWMDSITLGTAKEKILTMDKLIGYPDVVMSPTELDEKWQHIEALSPYKEIENIRKMHEANYIMNFRNRNQVSDIKWKQPATEVLGLYDRYNNIIKFTAGHFQYPYYEPQFTRAMKLGTLGHLMAHELTHAIDNQGRQNDATGNLYDWWTQKTALAYSNYSNCFAQDISATLPFAFDSYLLHEVIADAGGVKLAYNTFKDLEKSERQRNINAMLPGIDLPPDQLFFLAYAQMFCIQDHLTEHNYKRYRVVSSLKNTEAFASVYNCPVGSVMNPKNKCAVW